MAVAVGMSSTELGQKKRMVDDVPCPGLGVKGPPRRGCSTAALLYRASKQAQSLLRPSKREGKGAGGYTGTHLSQLESPATAPWIQASLSPPQQSGSILVSA